MHVFHWEGCFFIFSLATTAWSCNIIIMTPHLKCGKTYYCYATHFTLSVCNLVACMPGNLIQKWVGFSSIVASEWHCCVYIFSRFVSVSSSVGFHNSSSSSSGKNSAFVLFQLRAKMRQVKISICGFGECVNVPWRLTPITRLENRSHFQIQQLRSISFCWICTVNEWMKEIEQEWANATSHQMFKKI